ncbi:hypothetical protein EG68_05606 [Paragonimus skrjabini miyazakii]|uniref:Uncharacterized protein n=1 Tax=Paragonimus skrjabini miyazakii TaxID=59628 RepID=A0A8S9Z6D1_9TREM|nr:hypothetical protein EG68_05606 [Paragonimus skrjabini miyazakii]
MATVTLISLAVWLYRVFSPRARINFVRNYLKALQLIPLDRTPGNLLDFIDSYLGSDGLFIIRLIGVNCGGILASDLVAELWLGYKDPTYINMNITRRVPKLESDCSLCAPGHNIVHTAWNRTYGDRTKKPARDALLSTFYMSDPHRMWISSRPDRLSRQFQQDSRSECGHSNTMCPSGNGVPGDECNSEPHSKSDGNEDSGYPKRANDLLIHPTRSITIPRAQPSTLNFLRQNSVNDDIV